MRHRASGMVGGCAACALLLGAGTLKAQEEAPFFLGIQTHFVQDWRLSYLNLRPDIGAPVLRDELSWPDIESVPGVYDFTGSRAVYLQRAIDRGVDPLILFSDTNPLHDAGQTPYSRQGQNALAAYVVAVLDAFAPGLRRIEIGNEFNSDDFVSGPFTEDRTRHLATTLRAIHKPVRLAHPETEILCTGTLTVAMGFFRSLFENGILDYCDAISLHLYPDQPELVAGELDRLRALMAGFGQVLPIYVTEFGKWFDDPDDAPDFMLKMVAQMGAAGVAGAWWYALLDEPYWPNMGLYRPAPVAPMPAADSFRLLQESLLPLGRPRRIGATPVDQIYAFGEPPGAIIAWGAPAALVVSGATQFLDARGNPIAPVTTLSEVPVVILGEALEIHTERARHIVNVTHTFGQPPWSYHALRADGRLTPLRFMDWEWSTFLGDPSLRPLRVTQDWISGARFDTGAYHAIERFTAPEDGEYRVEARWRAPAEPDGDGANIEVSHNGTVIAAGVVRTEDFLFGPQEIHLAAGEWLDFAVGPHNEAGGDALRRENTLHYPPTATAP